MTDDVVSVRFMTKWGGYNAGEMAGFPPALAAKLCGKLSVAARVVKPAFVDAVKKKVIDEPVAEARSVLRHPKWQKKGR